MKGLRWLLLAAMLCSLGLVASQALAILGRYIPDVPQSAIDDVRESCASSGRAPSSIVKNLDAREDGESPDAAVAVNKPLSTPVVRGATSIDAYPDTVIEVRSMCDMDDEELRESLLNSHYLYGLP